MCVLEKKKDFEVIILILFPPKKLEKTEHIAIFKIDNQQGPTVQHRECCSIFGNNLNGKS